MGDLRFLCGALLYAGGTCMHGTSLYGGALYGGPLYRWGSLHEAVEVITYGQNPKRRNFQPQGKVCGRSSKSQPQILTNLAHFKFVAKTVSNSQTMMMMTRTMTDDIKKKHLHKMQNKSKTYPNFFGLSLFCLSFSSDFTGQNNKRHRVQDCGFNTSE